VISYVRGKVAALALDSTVVEIGGVGLTLHCTPSTLAQLRVGELAELATSLVVREESLTLYGFADFDERTAFELLQTATGVGPRLAQAMLAVHSPDALRRAVATEDISAFTQVPGIGKKGAQRILLELKGRLDTPIGSSDATSIPPGGASWRDQLHAALLGLGWSARQADEALTAVAPQADAMLTAGEAPDIAVLLRTALKTLSSR